MGNLDSEIDDVARRMTEAEPGASFKAQVLARIDSVNPRQGHQSPVWTWSAVAVAATATAVLALVIVRAPWKPETVRLQPYAKDTIRLKPDTTDGNRAKGALPDATPQGGTNVVEANRAEPASVTQDRTARATAPSYAVPSYVASGFSRTVAGASSAGRALREGDMGTQTDMVVGADRMLPPSPILIERIGVGSMATIDAIQIPGLDVAPLEVPALAIALLDVPAMP